MSLAVSVPGHIRECALRSARWLLCMLPPCLSEPAGPGWTGGVFSSLPLSPAAAPSCRPHTLNSTSTSKSFQSTVTGELNAPYSKQFVHSKSSQYRRMKTEWKSNVYLARSRIQVGRTSQEGRAGGTGIRESSARGGNRVAHAVGTAMFSKSPQTSQPAHNRWACTFTSRVDRRCWTPHLCSSEQAALASAYTRVPRALVDSPVEIVAKCAAVLDTTPGVLHG